MISLGRQPQVSGRNPHPEPCRGDRLSLRREPQRFQMMNLSPLRGFSSFSRVLYLGLTPQAKYLTPLRG